MAFESARPVLRLTRLWKVLIGVFLVVTCIRAWAPNEPVLSVAKAQVVNPSAQRRDLVREAKRTNQLLTDIKKILESGELKVRVEGLDTLGVSGQSPRKRGQ